MGLVAELSSFMVDGLDELVKFIRLTDCAFDLLTQLVLNTNK